MFGELSALVNAVFWTASSLMLKPQTKRLDAITMNLLRTSVGALFFVTWLLASGTLKLVAQVPAASLAFLLGSMLCSLVAGDTCFFLSMRSIGVGRAFPIAACYPLFTLAYAAALRIEVITPRLVLGGIFVVAGVAVIGWNPDKTMRRIDRAGVLFALLSAALVGLSAVLNRLGLQGVDVVTAGAIRLPAAVLVLALVRISVVGSGLRRATPAVWTLSGVVWVLLAGLAGTGLSTFFFLTSIKLAGPARASIISSCAPLLGILPSWLVLKEQMRPRVLFGTVGTFAGVVLAFVS